MFGRCSRTVVGSREMMAFTIEFVPNDFSHIFANGSGGSCEAASCGRDLTIVVSSNMFAISFLVCDNIAGHSFAWGTTC